MTSEPAPVLSAVPLYGAADPPTLQPPWRRVEWVFVAVAMFLYSNALIGPLFAPDQDTTDDLVWLRYLWLPAYAGTLVFGVMRWRWFRGLGAVWLLFGLLVGWAVLSAGWSIDPDTTHRRTLALFATTLFGIYLASSFRGRSLAVVIAASLVCLAVGSLAAVLLDPSLGLDTAENQGDWRGLWYQKNALGGMMAYGVLACLSAAIVSRRRWVWWAGGALCLALLLLSRSKTALLCVMAALCAYSLIWSFRRSALTGVLMSFALGTAAFVVVSLLWLAPDTVLAALGKDPTLTGRTDLWAAVGRQIAHRPLLGYGYAAFWTKDSDPAAWVRAETGWLVPSAHNGWLDMVAQLGRIGAGLTLLTVVAVAAAALWRGWRTREGHWAFFFVIAFLIRSLSESVLLAENSFDWAMFAAAATVLLRREPPETDEGELETAQSAE